jgi:hypothetical protein
VGSRRLRALGACVALGGGLALAGCGAGRQDAHEPLGKFPVRVERATFPATQRLAEHAQLVIVVRNAGPQTVPNIAVTVEPNDPNAPAQAAAFAQASAEPGVADPSRPVWVLDAGPTGGLTAYTNTWALGAMRPGEVRTFVWAVTAVKSGLHSIRYKVAAGLNGKAKAVAPGSGQEPAGQFTTRISGKPANARVADNGRVITQPRH